MLVTFTLIFCLGIIAGNLFTINFRISYFLCLLCLMLGLSVERRQKLSVLFISAAVFLFGALLISNSKIIPNCDISNYINYRKPPPYYLVKGIVYSEPVTANNKTSFLFKPSSFQQNNLAYSCCGKILAYTKNPIVPRYSQDLILYGNLYKPFAGGSAKSYRKYLHSRRIYTLMNVTAHQRITDVKKSPDIKIFSLKMKARFEAIIYRYLDKIPAGILDAMVLGEKKNIPGTISDSMIKSGTLHILVVSGFNVGIVSFIIILFLKILRVKRHLRVYIACFLLVIYCIMTGSSTPVVRATIMADVFMLSYFVKRECLICNSLCIAAIAILIMNPTQLFDIGFQLSFASVTAIVWIYPKIKCLLKINRLKSGFLNLILDAALVSLSAWIGTAGLIAYYFRIISPVTVLANLFIVPLASIITLCGFSTIAIGAVCPALADFFAAADEFIILLLLNINNLLIKLPGAYFYLKQTT